MPNRLTFMILKSQTLLLLFLLNASVSMSSAQYTPLGNFNELNLGQPLSGQGDWVVKNDAGGSAIIVKDPDDDKQQVLELRGPVDSEKMVVVAHDGLNIQKPPFPSVATIYFQFRLGSGDSAESLKVGVSHLLPDEVLAAGPVALKQYFWMRGGQAGWSPMLFNADGTAVEPSVSFETGVWYDAWFVISNGSESVSQTSLYVRSTEDPNYSEIRHIEGMFVETPVPVPFGTFSIIKQEPRPVLIKNIEYAADSECPGVLPE